MVTERQRRWAVGEAQLPQLFAIFGWLLMLPMLRMPLPPAGAASTAQHHQWHPWWCVMQASPRLAALGMCKFLLQHLARLLFCRCLPACCCCCCCHCRR